METCPRCNELYDGYPALSRLDNRTAICPACGTDEAMQDYMGVPLKQFPLDVAPEVNEVPEQPKEAPVTSSDINIQRLTDAGFTDHDLGVIARAFMVTNEALKEALSDESRALADKFGIDSSETMKAMELSQQIADKVSKYIDSGRERIEVSEQFKAWFQATVEEEDEDE